MSRRRESAAALAGAAARSNTEKTTPAKSTASDAYRVEILAPSGRVTQWGRYLDQHGAETVARKLRAHGFLAQVRQGEAAP